MTALKKKITAAVAQDLVRIETALSGNLSPEYELVREVAGYILFAGGKRLRPLLMVLCARACGVPDQRSAHFSVVFEYLHAATLLHDDVVDGGDMRRGRPAAHKVWDPPTAVLTGDFLLARALSLAAETGLVEVIRAIAAITEHMSQGEIRQLKHKGDLSLSEDLYMEIIRCKTAVLFEGACRVGALLAGAPAATVKALGVYGHHLGMAFQIADDLLDYTQDSAALGKKAGADLREGKLTLPVIQALSQAGHDDRQTLAGFIGRQNFSLSAFKDFVALLERLGGLDHARQHAAAHICAAKSALDVVSSAQEHGVMTDIADYALARGF